MPAPGTLDEIWTSSSSSSQPLPKKLDDGKRKRSSSEFESDRQPPTEVSLATIVSLITTLSKDVNTVKGIAVENTAKLDENMGKLDMQFAELKHEFSSLSATVQNLSDKQFDIVKENHELKAEIAVVKQEVMDLKAKDANRSKERDDEVAARDDLEAQQRRYNLTISGIVQQSENENCKDVANRFFSQLLPGHDHNTLDICHRTKGGELICRFATRSARDAIFKESKKKDGLRTKTTTDFGLPGNNIRNRIYVNESLTFLRSRISKAARAAVFEYNKTHPFAKRKAIVHKGFVKIVDANDNLHVMMKVESVEEFFK